MKKTWLYIKIFFQAIDCMISEDISKAKGRSIYTRAQKQTMYAESIDRLNESKAKLNSL